MSSSNPPQQDTVADAMKRTYALADPYRDRTNWSKEQWFQEAVALMDHIDGGTDSLLNGHTNALIWKAQRASKELARIRAVLEGPHHPGVELDPATLAHLIAELNKGGEAPGPVEEWFQSAAAVDALPTRSIVQGWDGFRHEKRTEGWMLLINQETSDHHVNEIELPAVLLFRGKA